MAIKAREVTPISQDKQLFLHLFGWGSKVRRRMRQKWEREREKHTTRAAPIQPLLRQVEKGVVFIIGWRGSRHLKFELPAKMKARVMWSIILHTIETPL
jgi:hypothetical protein